MNHAFFRKVALYEKGHLLFLCFLFVFLVFPFLTLAANEEYAVVISGPFSLSGAWGGILNVGSDAEVRSVGVRHEAETVEGSRIVLPSETLSFSYTPDEPVGVLDRGIFDRNPLRGAWVASLASGSDCSADPSVFLIGADRYSFKLCAIQPMFSLSSSNNAAVNCTGMTCTANGIGNARITATIAGMPTKIWGQKNVEGWQELVSMTLAPATLSWDVSVVAPPTLTFSMSGTNPIPNNTGTMLSWNAQNVISNNPCIASGDWSGMKVASGHFDTGNLQARRDYGLTCTGPSGNTVEGTVTVLVGSPTPGPTVVFTAGLMMVPVGTATTLSWDSPNADTCIAQGDWVSPPGPGPRPTNGNESTGPIFAGMTKTFVLSCSNIGGTTPRTLSVSALPPLSPPLFRNFSVSSNPIAYNGSTTLSWDVQNATSCIASSDAAVSFANWSGSIDPVGSRTVSGITKTPTTRFSLSCTGAGGTTLESVDVSVAPSGLGPPTITLWADSTNIPYNTGATIHWTTTQADLCKTNDNGDDVWWHFDETGPIINADYTTMNLTTTKTYTVTCQNMLYSRSQSITIRVGESSNPVTLNFTADRYIVPYDTGTTLRWQSTNATVCTAGGPWPGGLLGVWTNGEMFTGQIDTGNLRNDVTYTLSCQNSSGPPVPRVVTITIDPGTILPPPPPPPPVPVVYVWADSTFLSYNTGTTIRWSAQNADSCTAHADPILFSWTGSKNSVSGSIFTGNLHGDVTFYLDCTGPGGTEGNWVDVTVGNSFLSGPSLSFWADNFVVPPGGSTRLRWTSSGATDSCVASGDWSGNKNQNNAAGQLTGLIMEPKAYRLTCFNAGGSITATVNVLVGTENPTASLSLWADETAVPVGGSTKIRWNAQNVRAGSCVASADPLAPGIWSGSVPFVGERSTGPLAANQTYILTCQDSDGNSIEARTRVGAGTSFGSGPEINLTADAYDIPLGTAPTLHLQAFYVTACRTVGPGWLKHEILPSTNMSFDSSFVGAINASVTYIVECTDASDPLSPMAVWGSTSVPIRVVQVLLCPVSIPILRSGDTVRFNAWYTEDASVTCGTPESLRGTDVTTSADTIWQIVSGGGSLSPVSPGEFLGTSYGVATVRAIHRPPAGTAYIPSREITVSVARRIDCFECDSATSSCSPSTPHYSTNDTDTCSTFNEFDSRATCRFSCFKDRWEEVAP